MWRTVRLAAAVVIVVGGLAACEPPPPPVVIEVNSLASGRDVNPGDGVCETAPGNGECTVAAAIDEGNAVGRAVVRVPDASAGELEPIADPVSITGDVTITAEVSQDYVTAWFAGLQVEPGAILRLERAIVVAEHLVVEGTLLVDRTWLIADNTVDSSGRLLALNSILTAFSGDSGPRPVVENHGFFWMRYTFLAKEAPALHTAPGATSRIGASLISTNADGACTGVAAETDGYNEGGTSCVNGPTDDVSGSNSIPVGVLGCGTDVVVDMTGKPRPGLGNPDFGPGCTPGPWQEGG